MYCDYHIPIYECLWYLLSPEDENLLQLTKKKDTGNCDFVARHYTTHTSDIVYVLPQMKNGPPPEAAAATGGR